MSVLRLALIIIAVFCLSDPFDDRSGAFPGRVVRDRHSRSLAGEQKGDRLPIPELDPVIRAVFPFNVSLMLI